MKRVSCNGCGRPIKVCLCSWLQTIDNLYPLTIFRHKSETAHALNTVNILQRSLCRLQVFDGELFNPECLPASSPSFLVYPGADAEPIEKAAIPERAHFLMLDGSWKKTKRILYLNPWINDLPKIALPFRHSHYILRKQKEQGYSTLEAAHSLLSIAEKNEGKYQPLIDTLVKMMQLQSEFIDPEKFSLHFGQRISKISFDKNGSKAASLSGHNSPDDTLPHPRSGMPVSQQ